MTFIYDHLKNIIVETKSVAKQRILHYTNKRKDNRVLKMFRTFYFMYASHFAEDCNSNNSTAIIIKDLSQRPSLFSAPGDSRVSLLMFFHL